jgi:hypothetical protein
MIEIEDDQEAVNVTWKKEVTADDFRPPLKRFRGYLQDNGIRDSTAKCTFSMWASIWNLLIVICLPMRIF